MKLTRDELYAVIQASEAYYKDLEILDKHPSSTTDSRLIRSTLRQAIRKLTFELLVT